MGFQLLVSAKQVHKVIILLSFQRYITRHSILLIRLLKLQLRKKHHKKFEKVTDEKVEKETVEGKKTTEETPKEEEKKEEAPKKVDHGRERNPIPNEQTHS